MQYPVRAISPTLDLYPVVYHPAPTQSFVDSYGSAADSVIFPFRDDPLRTTRWTGTLRAQLDTLAARLATKSRKLILMVYATTLSQHGAAAGPAAGWSCGTPTTGRRAAPPGTT